MKIKNEWRAAVSSNIEEAKRERDRLAVELQGGGSLRGGQQTIRDYAEADWLPLQRVRVQEGRLRASTLKEYQHALTKHVLPALGSRRLRELTPADVQRFRNDLTGAGLAPYTVLNALKPLRAIYTLAVSRRDVMFNPVAVIDKPAAKREREPYALTDADVAALADKAPTMDDRNLILAAAYTGLRFGELAGLRWEDAELSEGKETLRVAVQFYDGQLVEAPKTPSGRRRIPLPAQAAEALRSQLRESKRHNPLGVFFPSEKGQHLRASNWNRRVWQDTREAAGLPDLHFHDLRSYFLTGVTEAAVPRAAAMKLGGHSDDRTHDGYVTLSAEAEDAAREALTARFAPKDDAQPVAPE